MGHTQPKVRHMAHKNGKLKQWDFDQSSYAPGLLDPRGVPAGVRRPGLHQEVRL
jgi:hypothetical protein